MEEKREKGEGWERERKKDYVSRFSLYRLKYPLSRQSFARIMSLKQEASRKFTSYPLSFHSLRPSLPKLLGSLDLRKYSKSFIF